MFGEDNAPLSVQHGEKVIDGIEREREEKLATLVSSQGEREREREGGATDVKHGDPVLRNPSSPFQF